MNETNDKVLVAGTMQEAVRDAVKANARRPGKAMLAVDPDSYRGATSAEAAATMIAGVDAVAAKFPAYFWSMLTKGKAAGDPPVCPRCAVAFSSWKARRGHMRANAASDSCT